VIHNYKYCGRLNYNLSCNRTQHIYFLDFLSVYFCYKIQMRMTIMLMLSLMKQKINFDWRWGIAVISAHHARLESYFYGFLLTHFDMPVNNNSFIWL